MVYYDVDGSSSLYMIDITVASTSSTMNAIDIETIPIGHLNNLVMIDNAQNSGISWLLDIPGLDGDITFSNILFSNCSGAKIEIIQSVASNGSRFVVDGVTLLNSNNVSYLPGLTLHTMREVIIRNIFIRSATIINNLIVVQASAQMMNSAVMFNISVDNIAPLTSFSCILSTVPAHIDMLKVTNSLFGVIVDIHVDNEMYSKLNKSMSNILLRNNLVTSIFDIMYNSLDGDGGIMTSSNIDIMCNRYLSSTVVSKFGANFPLELNIRTWGGNFYSHSYTDVVPSMYMTCDSLGVKHGVVVCENAYNLYLDSVTIYGPIPFPGGVIVRVGGVNLMYLNNTTSLTRAPYSVKFVGVETTTITEAYDSELYALIGPYDETMHDKDDHILMITDRYGTQGMMCMESHQDYDCMQ